MRNFNRRLSACYPPVIGTVTGGLLWLSRKRRCLLSDGPPSDIHLLPICYRAN